MCKFLSFLYDAVLPSFILDPSVSAANSSSKFTTRSFYIEYRMAVGYATDESNATDESKPRIPVFTTLEQWEPVKSTKMDACAKICQYMLTRDNIPEPIFKDGQVIFPSITQPLQTGEKKETKILIYQEFTSLRPLLRNVNLSYLPFQSNVNNLSFRFLSCTAYPLCRLMARHPSRTELKLSMISELTTLNAC